MLSWPPATTIVRIAVQDRLVAERHRLEARAAQDVDAVGRYLLGHAGIDRRLARGVLALAGGQDLAEDDLGDLGRVDLRPLQARLDHRLAQIVRRHAAQRAAERADWRPRGADDHDVGHY